MNLIKLNVKTNNQKYPIIIGSKLFNKIPKILKKIQLILINVYCY